MSDLSLSAPGSWHPRQWQELVDRLLSGTLPHALLLHGQGGIGKHHFALDFARSVLCEQRQPDGACGACRPCLLNRAGSHPDLLLVEPESHGKPIKIDQIRRVVECANMTAQQRGFRVVILNPAESLNVYSANALLKSLEEPQERTLFLLISQQIRTILPTIRSRCQMVPFVKPNRQQAVQWLQQQGLERERAHSLLALAAGGPLTAVWYEQQGLAALAETMQSGLLELTRGQRPPVQVAAQWADYDIITVLEWMALWVQEAACYRATGQRQRLSDEPLAAMLEYTARRTSLRALVDYHQWLLEQRRWRQRGSQISAQLLLEELLCRWLDLNRKGSAPL